nr:chemotaxis protein CheW [Desulfobulbaceae bacterium]
MPENALLFGDENSLQLCTFYLAERLYGLTITDVKEVSGELTITPVHHAPKEVCGYVNIRGSYYLILNLRMMCGYDCLDIGRESRIVLFKPEAGESFGVLVDKIGDITKVNTGLIEDRRKKNTTLTKGESDRRSRTDFVSGVCKLEDKLIILLNARMMLASINKQ